MEVKQVIKTLNNAIKWSNGRKAVEKEFTNSCIQ